MITNPDKAEAERVAEENCECKYWARASVFPATNHHPHCPKYDPLGDAVAILRPLVKGMEDWGKDEDGIPEHVWDAYTRAKIFLGETNFEQPK